MNACANCNQAWGIFMAQLRMICMWNVKTLRPVAVLSFNTYLLSVNQKMNLRQSLWCFGLTIFFCFSHYCVLAYGECLWSVVLERKWEIFPHLFNFFLFIFIQLQELYKAVLYENSNSSLSSVSFFLPQSVQLTHTSLLSGSGKNYAWNHMFISVLVAIY